MEIAIEYQDFLKKRHFLTRNALDMFLTRLRDFDMLPFWSTAAVSCRVDCEDTMGRPWDGMPAGGLGGVTIERTTG